MKPCELSTGARWDAETQAVVGVSVKCEAPATHRYVYSGKDFRGAWTLTCAEHADLYRGWLGVVESLGSAQ